MFKIRTLNKIPDNGILLISEKGYLSGPQVNDPDAILLRSFNMHEMELPTTVMAIARAGAGVDNIPVENCTKRGIVVFNTPGANANGVKELVIASLFLVSRKIVQGITWTKGLAGKEGSVKKHVEEGKAVFSGPEIVGKQLGVIGLGAIGIMVANDASALGMNVIGYDPFISVDAAWGLSRSVSRAPNLEKLLSVSDYVTIHVPLNDKTKCMLNYETFTNMKKGVRLLNFARGELVNNDDLIRAINEGIVNSYITDFPDEKLLKIENVITLPHLGASTPESTDNCAVMAVKQMLNYLETGNIKNSVNFPDCEANHFNTQCRVTIANENIPNMVGQITSILAEEKINISGMVNKHKNSVAYNIIDTDSAITADIMEKTKMIKGVIMVRVI